MNELKWFSCTNPHEMLAFLKEKKSSGLASALCWFGLRKSKVSNRKLQLFACACCRRLGPLLADERSREALEIGELHAGGLVGKKAFRQAVHAAREASAHPRVTTGGWLAAAQARAAQAVAGALEGADPADDAATWSKEAVRAWGTQKPSSNATDSINSPKLPHPTVGPEAAWIAEGVAECVLLREIFGNPFHQAILERSCRRPEAVTLALSIFRDRSFTRLAELAGMLEQAGCTNRELLQHFQRKEEHTRGCWALDLVLGKD